MGSWARAQYAYVAAHTPRACANDACMYLITSRAERAPHEIPTPRANSEPCEGAAAAATQVPRVSRAAFRYLHSAAAVGGQAEGGERTRGGAWPKAPRRASRVPQRPVSRSGWCSSFWKTPVAGRARAGAGGELEVSGRGLVVRGGGRGAVGPRTASGGGVGWAVWPRHLGRAIACAKVIV